MDLKFYTVLETAQILRISVNSLYRKLESGEFKAGRVGIQWRVTEDDIKTYTNRRVEKPKLKQKREFNILSKKIV